ncbi:MAG: hypothetical protein JWO99_53 [Candidatus Saccharibacteria bacterium]|nr:hypothetical protein [Candidatus Saccharibacteria bacterium]
MERPKLIVLETQPDFPGEDLSEHNADMLGTYYLRHTIGLEGEAERLFEHQRALFELAQLSLWLRNIRIDDAPREYRSFTQGFAAYELVQSLVTGAAYNTGLAVMRADLHLINSNNAPFAEIAERSVLWPFERPNLYQAITVSGEAKKETEAQLHARVTGAQLAFELQRPLFDAA